MPVIHWFRRDLRLSDNRALQAAIDSGAEVLSIYLLSSWKNSHEWTGPTRQQFLCESLTSLARSLESVGSRLHILEGDPLTLIPEIAARTRANAVYTNRDPDPHGRRTEALLAKRLETDNRLLRTFQDHVLHEADEVLTGAGTPYRVFTPYSRNWIGLPKPKPGTCPRQIRPVSGFTHPAIRDLPTLAHWKLPAAPDGILPGGERAARKRLRRALAADGPLPRYATDRDLPAGRTTSRLSQDLRFGLLSIREVFARSETAARQTDAPAREGIRTFQKELAWREFYFQILHHFPEVLLLEFNPDYRGLPWDRDPDSEPFARWCAGRTGFPVIDAGMRQLRATGFMHNRLRMITSMFLTKDLHIDWRLGEAHFMRHLIDGEIASNNGGWQWSAGTGADAAPYFRIQNPWTQSKRHDPRGAYIRRWIPELAQVPDTALHKPPEPDQSLAPEYPSPLVDHGTERARTLEIFKAHRRKKSA